MNHTIQDVPLAAILLADPPDPGTPEYDEISRMVSSIKAVGLLQPPILQEAGDMFRIVAGRTRIQAFARLEREFVPCLLHGDLDYPLAHSLIAENLARRSSNFMEEAFQLALYEPKDEADISRLAQLTGRTGQWIKRRLNALGFHSDIQDLLRSNRISYEAATIIHQVKDPKVRDNVVARCRNHHPNVDTVKYWTDLATIAARQPAAALHRADPGPQPAAQRALTFTCGACGLDHPFEDLAAVQLCRMCEVVLKPPEKPVADQSPPEPAPPTLTP